jgi:hypothetical protein
MRLDRLALSSVLVPLAACTAPGGPSPSLAPRAAEAIDPRLPVIVQTKPGPADPVLAGRIATLLAQARQGDAAFRAAAAEAERLAAVAGAPQSESWVLAQQALSAAVAARQLTTRALGDVDALASTAIAGRGGLAPADLAAIETAAGQVAAIDRRQAAAIDLISRRHGG